MQLTADLSQLHPAVRNRIIRKLQHEDAAQYELGVVRQAKMKKLMDQISVPGLYKSQFGRQQFIMDPDQAGRLRHKYGPLCFMDPDFIPWLMKRPAGEDMKCKDVGTRIQSGYTGRGHSRSGRGGNKR